MNFGFRSGKTRLDFKTIFGIRNYIQHIMKTALKWVFIVGMIIGVLLSSLIQASTMGILFIIGLMLLFGFLLTYPIHLLMSVSGDRDIGKVLTIYVVNIIIVVIAFLVVLRFSILTTLPEIGLIISIGSWVLAVGLVYPKKVTIIDSIAILFIPSIVFFLILILIGGASISAVMIGERLTQSIMSIV